VASWPDIPMMHAIIEVASAAMILVIIVKPWKPDRIRSALSDAASGHRHWWTKE